MLLYKIIITVYFSVILLFTNITETFKKQNYKEGTSANTTLHFLVCLRLVSLSNQTHLFCVRKTYHNTNLRSRQIEKPQFYITFMKIIFIQLQTNVEKKSHC